jgi:uncharacterized protein (TIGR00297 family)
MPKVIAFAEGVALTGASAQVWVAAAVTVVFTAFARLVKGVSSSGAIAGALVCFLLYVGAGPGAFVALVSVFALTWLATRLGYQRKQALGTAEKREGRTASQVLANLAVAAACCGLYGNGRNAIFLLAAAAALSEAAADTVSSELGQAWSDRARLITNWQVVPAGTDGGVTWLGSCTGWAAAALVSWLCVLVGLLPTRWLAASLLGAVAGTIADSYLGALLERRKLLNNDWVNFLSTLIAAAVACGLARIS